MCACKYTSSSWMGGGVPWQSKAQPPLAMPHLSSLVFDAYSHCQCFKRNCTPNQKLVCFVRELLKIINIFLIK